MHDTLSFELSLFSRRVVNSVLQCMELEVKEQDKGALLLMPQLLLTMKIQVKYGVVFVWQEELKCLKLKT